VLETKTVTFKNDTKVQQKVMPYSYKSYFKNILGEETTSTSIDTHG
jgi:hypothetical protein